MASPSQTSPSPRKKRTPVPPPVPATLTDVVEELKALRRDLVVLCRVIVTNQKSHRVSLERTIKLAEQPGVVSSNVQAPSWFDAVFEAERGVSEE
jgi:hypothetical protein